MFEKKKMLVVLGSVVLLVLSFGLASAKELPLEPFLYTEDFEGEKDPFRAKARNPKHTVNFKGLTEEKAFSGKKSFKLDVTLKNGTYFWWKIPLGEIPIQGELKFSARILVGEETEGKARASTGLVANYPYVCSGVKMGTGASAAKEGWKLAEKDVVEDAKQWSYIAKVLKTYKVWGYEEGELGAVVTDVYLYLYKGKAKKGESRRVVVYIDDIKLEGKVPSKEDYKKELKRRRAKAKERFQEKIVLWDNALAEMQKDLNAIKNLSLPSAKEMKLEAEKSFSFLKGKIEKQREIYSKKGCFSLQAKEIDIHIENLRKMIKDISAEVYVGVTGNTSSVLCYIVNPISSIKILPKSFVHGRISNAIRIIACSDEYEPASFVLHSLKDINALKIEPTPLIMRKKFSRSIIPSSSIDIKAVKCWYQGEGAWYNSWGPKGKRVLVPELLLKDDSLVKVDYEKKENYLKLSFPEGEKYVWISNPDEETKERSKKRPLKELNPVEDYPVKDSFNLLPVDITAKMNKQFWVTVKVPENANPGIYAGKINLSTPKEVIGSINIRLKVLPFKLAKPYYTPSIYYRGVLHQSYPKGTISSEYKSEEQLRAELKNMFAHGVTNPTVYQPFHIHRKELFTKYLQIRNEVGIDKTLYFLDYDYKYAPKAFLAFVKPFGIEEVYFYGFDEASGEKLKAQRLEWEATREAGGKIFAAGKNENFGSVGDIQDLHNNSLFPSKEEADKWHSVGHKIWAYGCPEGGVENPEIYRRNYGLLLWQNDYDGTCVFSYHDSYYNIWNDFDRPGAARDQCFTYPTVNGVIDTLAWEGHREAIDDVRYITTLIKTIEKAKKSKDKKIRDSVISAEKYLKKLKSTDLTTKDLNAVRLEIINYILELNGGMK